MFLAGALGPGWFEVLEALQNADYVPTMRGAGPLGPTALGPNTGAGRAAFGTPSKAVR